jgi:hypothetical protein
MPESHEQILELIRERSVLKQDVFANTKTAFEELKGVLDRCMDEIQDHFGKSDDRVTMHYREKGEFEAEIKIAGDILIFHMHTNVGKFDSSSSLWQTGYLEEDPSNGYVGVINVYNFLSDSLQYNRENDVGYLIARIFINRENHYLVQGKGQLGYRFNDFIHEQWSKEKLMDIVHTAILYTLDFDLYAPPYSRGQIVTVSQIQSLSERLNIATGKRLGFQFGIDNEER